METFSGRFWEIPGNVLKLELLKMLIDHKTPRYSSKQSLECLREVFLTNEPNTNEKKTATKHQFIACLAFWREKQGCLFGYFFIRVPIFDPTLVQYFIQIPHIIFCCPLSTYDKWWFEQKKSPHFWEKYLVLSYLNRRHPVRITSSYPEFNRSHFGLPPSSVHRMTGLGGNFVSLLWCIRTCRLVSAKLDCRRHERWSQFG